MKSNAKSNAKKTAKRAGRGGRRDVEKFPTEFGPSKGKPSSVNFYGHMSYSRAKQLRREARKIREERLAKLPLWMRRVFAK